jgi:hypothetical protein
LRSGEDSEGIRTILEGSCNLVGVNLQRESLASILHIGILGEWAFVLAIVLVVKVLSGGVSIEVARGDVVTNSENAFGLGGDLGKCPGVVSGFGVSRLDVTELVFSTGSGERFAGGSINSVWWDQLPLLTKLGAIGFVVGELSCLVFGVSNFVADTLGFDVEALGLKKATLVGVISVDGNIFPGVRVPVRIVVSFFGNFETMAISIFVLASLGGSSLVTDISVSDP